ncbi:alpha/beta hydrolase [Clostridium sp.]|uniref:alpha/beta hydrolase n=1 Tax=Clostridium sp. TaxID=1506 RepID=UPI002A8E8B80|nr:alpha/beta hydrolase [Clostridium sp.]
MRLLQYSNSMQKYKLKKKWNKILLIQWVVLVVFIVVFGGYLYENVQVDRVETNNRKTSRVATVDESKIYYNVTGQNGYTVILESNSGYGSVEWSNVTKKSPKDMKFLYYDRSGYGRSEKIDKQRTPEQEAKELHTLIQKSQYKAPYVFVGNEYGSLIVDAYNKLYGDEIAGVVLINPIENAELETLDKIKEISSLMGQKVLGSIGMMRIAENLGIINLDEEIVYGLSKSNAELYKNFRVNSKYPTMKLKEMKGLKGYKSDYSWIHEGKKEAVILKSSDDLSEDREKVKDFSHIEIAKIEENGTSAVINDWEAVLNAIENVISRLPNVD